MNDFEAWEGQFDSLKDPFAQLSAEERRQRTDAATARLQEIALGEDLELVERGICTPDEIVKDKLAEQEWLRDNGLPDKD